MKYNVGDRVQIKSIDWYNKNKDKDGFVHCGDRVFDDYMSVFCESVVTIEEVSYNGYSIQEDMQCRTWTDEMIEGLVGETKPEFKIGDKITNGKVTFTILTITSDRFVIKKKKEYPKTYEECCKVLGWNHRDYDRVGYKSDLLCKLQVLLLCRDAYWKIAGEEMGLNKPWEPDWSDDNEKYSIYTIKGVLTKAISCYDGAIFSFPTEEMRDAFKENFNPVVEICKEFL